MTSVSSRGSTARLAGARAASRARRFVLGLAMRLPGSSDPQSLLARFPDESLLPLRRVGVDPLPRLATLPPVSRLKLPLGLRGWLVTGYDETRAVLAGDPRVFSNDFANMVGKVGIKADQDPGGLGFTDPPKHTRLRHLLTPHFTARALAARGPRVREIVEHALDALSAAAGASADGVVDLQQHFALPIPSQTIMELLGVHDSARDEFQRLSKVRFDFDAADGAAGSFDPIHEAVELLREVVARQRVEPVPGLISQILADHGEDIDDLELAGLADGVLTGGLETTVSMLSLGALHLLTHPADFADLRDSDAHVDALVEELLRHLTVVQVGFPRFAAQDTSLGSQQILAGDVVLCSLNVANRDPRHGGGETVDVVRASSGHLAFGHGLHRCVGAELARMELRIAYPALVRRFPALRLAVDPSELRFRDLSFVYGVQALPVRLE